MEITANQRKFKINHRIFDCLTPNLPFAQAYKQFQRMNPIARTVAMFEEDGQLMADGSILYEIYLPAKKNG